MCKNDATCVDLMGSFLCKCNPGWTGQDCSEEINYCASFSDLCPDFGGMSKKFCVPHFGGATCSGICMSISNFSSNLLVLRHYVSRILDEAQINPHFGSQMRSASLYGPSNVKETRTIDRRAFPGFQEDLDVIELVGKSNVVFVSTAAGGNFFEPSTWCARVKPYKLGCVFGLTYRCSSCMGAG